MTKQSGAIGKVFRLEEATIDELHQAIRAGETICVEIVQHYINRVRAYNGICSMLVTEDGSPVPQAVGATRAQKPTAFPSTTVKASTLLPELDKYKGPPLEYGRMEPTASDPSVQQQFGMIVGIPNAGQVNALGTLNIRGERSVTCRGDFDRHPSQGALPAGAPAVCELFRRLPDAIERAAELDAVYGRNPDLEKMPMYGVVFSFKDFSTPGICARLAVETPPMTLIFQRATMCWSSNCATKAQSSSPKRSTRNTMVALAIQEAATSPGKYSPQRRDISAAPGTAIRRILTIRRARPRSARVRGPAYL